MEEKRIAFGQLLGKERDTLLDLANLKLAFRQIVDGRPLCIKEKMAFPIWRSAHIGTPLSSDELRRTLTGAGVRIADWANDILGKVETAEPLTHLGLVLATSLELGYLQRATLQQIDTNALSFGLQHYLPGVGLLLSLGYPPGLKDMSVIIGMEPVADSGGNSRVFAIGHDGFHPWLFAYSAHPSRLWDKNTYWAFQKAVKVAQH